MYRKVSPLWFDSRDSVIIWEASMDKITARTGIAIVLMIAIGAVVALLTHDYEQVSFDPKTKFELRTEAAAHWSEDRGQ